MRRLRFLDWARGIAVIIMILCHTFNSFTRLDLRSDTGYILSQRIGGMASVLFLFMAGMTFAFQMAGFDRRIPAPLARWRAAFRRALYLFALAYGFRLVNWAFYFPNGNWQGVFKVDILNCMGLAMAMFSVLAMAPARLRPALAAAAGCLIAAVSPLLAMLDWHAVPKHLYAYIVGQRGAFAAFPFATYMACGLAAGALVRRNADTGVRRLMLEAAALGAAMIGTGWYFSVVPFTPYPKLDYWFNSPALVCVNAGVALMVLALSYAWCAVVPARNWSWVEALGKQSLLVYFVHIMLVYGWIFGAWKTAMNVWQAAVATAVVIALMVALARFRNTQQEQGRSFFSWEAAPWNAAARVKTTPPG